MQPSITLIIIIITCVISVSAFNNGKVMEDLIFYPPAVKRGQWYRLFSCGLIHADAGHLIFNMLALYIFGMGSYQSGVEYKFMAIFGESGKWIYLLMYIMALGFSLLPTYIKHTNNYHYRGLGASGAVSAVVFAKILMDPITGIGMFFIPVYIAGFIFGVIYIWVSNWMDKKNMDNVNHSAHIFGALFGVGFTIIACYALSEYPILTAFVDQIRNMDPKKIIQFSTRTY